MSDTPRTDAEEYVVQSVGNYGMGEEYDEHVVSAEFARQLEREALTMKTCKTCRWWDDGNCTRVDEYINEAIADGTDVLFAIKVNAADDHSLFAYLRTGPGFGCVLHEAREETIYE